VFVNLIMNAKDALQDKGQGTVRIVTRPLGDGVELRIEDDGAGMSPETMRKIYDPFFTTKSSPKEGQRKGTGLGLAVTYGIVQEHGATIEVASRVGEGTTFRLVFPAAETAARRSAPERSSPDDGALQDGKVVHA
jgi:two-component system, NtrC family, sensor kinase